MNACDELRERLAAYADGELDDTARARVRAHLVDCVECRRELAGLERVDALLRRAPVPEPSDAEWEKISAVLDREIATAVSAPAARGAKRGFFGWWMIPAGALAAAAALLAAFLIAPKPVPQAQITTIEVGQNYEYGVTLPAKDGDFLIIDVTNAQ